MLSQKSPNHPRSTPLVTVVWDAASVPCAPQTPSRTIAAALSSARSLFLRSRAVGSPCRYEAVWVTRTAVPLEDVERMNALQVAVVRCDGQGREALIQVIARVTQTSTAIVLISGDIRTVGAIKLAEEEGVELVLVSSPDCADNVHVLAAYASRDMSLHSFMHPPPPSIPSTSPSTRAVTPQGHAVQPLPSHPPLSISGGGGYTSPATTKEWGSVAFDHSAASTTSLTRSFRQSTDSTNGMSAPPACFSMPIPLMVPLTGHHMGGALAFEHPLSHGVMHVQGIDVDVHHLENDTMEQLIQPPQWCYNAEPHTPTRCPFVHVKGEPLPTQVVIVSGERVHLCKLARNDAYRHLSSNPRGSRKWCSAKGATGCFVPRCRFAHPLITGLSALVAPPEPAAPTTAPTAVDEMFPQGAVVDGTHIKIGDLVWNAFLAQYHDIPHHERVWCRNDAPHDMGSCRRAHRNVYPLAGGGTVEGRLLLPNTALANLRRNTRFRGTWCSSPRPHDPMMCTYLHRRPEAMQ